MKTRVRATARRKSRVFLWLAVAGIWIVAPAAFGAAQGPSTAPLIERAKFFGNPAASQGQVSPDGKWLSWLAPRNGVMNVWVAPAADPTAARALSAETVRPIRQYLWAPDSSAILYLNDKAGDENFILYAVDLATAATRTLTPSSKVRADVVGVSPAVLDQIIIALNDRDPQWRDLYRLDLRTGNRTLMFKNEGEFAAFAIDDKLELRLVQRNTPDGSDVFRVTAGEVETQVFDRVPFDDSRNTSYQRFSADGRTVYWLDTRGRDTAALIAQNVATGAKRLLASAPRADIGTPIFDPRTGSPDAYPVNYLKTQWKALNGSRRKDFRFLQMHLPGELRILSRSQDDTIWVVSTDPVTAPQSAHVYDRRRQRLTPLYVSQPALESEQLAPVHPVIVPARDGLPMVSYLTLPVGSDRDGDGRPERALPLVLLVHGGPWLRDSYGYSPRAQWLANRGYAVLATNFRASLGFGKKFLGAGDRQWGLGIQQDLSDAVDWAIRAKITAADKVAIMGQSFGGYSVLAGLAFTPEKYACGVDTAGPSNIESLIAATPAMWEPARQDIYRRMGDPRTDAGRSALRAQSPLFSAANIRRPLLIGQGANDPRVPKAEADQIVAAMRGNAAPVTYVVFPDEGHNYARPQNLIAFYAVAEQFLASCLGGRAQPLDGAVEASSMVVEVEGALTPGLADAVRRRPSRAQ